MQHTKIEWVKNSDGTAGYSWNPIRGICPVGCFYCYAKRLYQRFGWDPALRVDYAEINAPFPKKPSKIFLCSTMELFHPSIDKLEIRDAIFEIIAATPQHTFIILTKMPERIDRAMPENVWLGVSVEGPDEWWRAKRLAAYVEAKTKFISFEPLLGDLMLSDFPYVIGEFDWAVIGRLTGHGHKHDPDQEWVRSIFHQCRLAGVPVFMKENLVPAVAKKVVQEFPKEKY